MSVRNLLRTDPVRLSLLGQLHRLRERRALQLCRAQGDVVQAARALVAERNARGQALRAERAGIHQMLMNSTTRVRGEALQAIESRRSWLSYELERALYQLDQAERRLADELHTRAELEVAWRRCREKSELSDSMQITARRPAARIELDGGDE